MTSASTPTPSRFVPSAALARLALQATQRQQPPLSQGTARLWVTSAPQAAFVDEAASFGPAQERLDATPETLPELDTQEIVQRTQQAIGTRVERLLSSFGFEAAARNESTFEVTEGDQFTTPVQEGLLKSLPLPRSEAGPVLSLLVQELREAASNQALAGDWGALRETPQGLVLAIAGPLERLPADRPRARVVGGIAHRR